MITELNLPVAELKLSKKACDLYVWCIIRKKSLLLTPEEWVRQHVIHYLVNKKNYPLASIASEMMINVNRLSRRCDLVVYNQTGKPIIIIECKAPEVKISETTFYQIAQYNSKLGVDYLLMTNGLDHYVCKVDHKTGHLAFLHELPEYGELKI